MPVSTNFTKLLNKQISLMTKKTGAMSTVLVDWLFIIAAYLWSFFTGEQKKNVAVLKLKTKSQQDVVINCLGCVDLGSDLQSFQTDLRSIAPILGDADFSFASSRFGKHSTKAYTSLSKLLKEYHVTDVAHANKFIKSRMYQTAAGNVAVCACMLQYSSASSHHIRLELVREYFMLKRMGADYVIMYLDSKQQEKVTDKNNRLCTLLLKAGVDYIVNVKPYLIDSGVTYRQKNASVSRAVYSVGTFLSDRPDFPQERVAIRIKLRNVNGKLQAFEEGYYPLKYNFDRGFADLTNAKTLLTKAEITSLAKIENSMPRIRRVDRIITVGDLVEVMGATLPEQFAYIRDFSIGRFSARAGSHSAGDVYLRWRPHTESNDAATYEKRVKFAEKFTRKTSKVDMFIVSYKDFGLKTPHVVVEDSMEAHVAVGALLRNQHDFRCVAVTGSIGKTSTKDMMAEVMKLHYNTVKSEKNANIHSKISICLQKITSDCEVYIQEMGGGRPGGASRHARMVLPEATVVTNIGDAHIGNFDGDKVALMNNKLEITHGMPEHGILYLNGDDPLLANAKPNCKTVFFAVHNKNADFYADDIVVEGSRTYFNIVHKGRKVAACVNVPGEHNVLNAICSFAVGKQFGVPESTMVIGMANFKTEGIRQNVVPASGRKLFFDCYNASSGSVESSIKALRQIDIPEHGRRVAVVGDITGLGDLAVSTHKDIAQVLIANPADFFIFYGTNTKYTYDIVTEAGFEAYYTSDYDTLCRYLQEKTRPGDAVMAKGSSKMKLEYAFDRSFGTRSFDPAMIEEGTYFRAEVGGVTFNLFETHATAVRAKEGKKHVQVKGKIGTVKVCCIASTFGPSSLETVALPESIRHIDARAFLNCKNLKRVAGAKNLMYIGKGAFKNCTSLEAFDLPETLLHIGQEAFWGCTSLKTLHIPASVAQIDAEAFVDCPELKITCKAGSYAESYLIENHIHYECV